jgi:hypothetical protein
VGKSHCQSLVGKTGAIARSLRSAFGRRQVARELLNFNAEKPGSTVFTTMDATNPHNLAGVYGAAVTRG